MFGNRIVEGEGSIVAIHLESGEYENNQGLEGASVVYTALIESEVDGQYSIHLPALGGVHSCGSSRQEALERVVEAAELWIEVERHHGRDVPANDPLVILAEVNRVIADQRSDGLDPQLELVSVAVPIAAREAA